MTRYAAKIGLLGLLVWGALVSPSCAKDGYLSVTFTKAGLVGGVGAGRGVLTFEGREHPFTVYGLSLGVAIGGFALVAYPAEYGNSGVMTFLVNHVGTVYQKDLGERTEAIAGRMRAFDPDQTWKKVEIESPPSH